MNLDLSLFERLVEIVKAPHITLSTQRRMRPEIAAIVGDALYPSLKNHSSVLGFPNIRGMKHNVLFYNHSQHEKKMPRDDQSVKVNEHEVKMVIGLVKYLLKQVRYNLFVRIRFFIILS